MVPPFLIQHTMMVLCWFHLFHGSTLFVKIYHVQYILSWFHLFSTRSIRFTKNVFFHGSTFYQLFFHGSTLFAKICHVYYVMVPPIFHPDRFYMVPPFPLFLPRYTMTIFVMVPPIFDWISLFFHGSTHFVKICHVQYILSWFHLFLTRSVRFTKNLVLTWFHLLSAIFSWFHPFRQDMPCILCHGSTYFPSRSLLHGSTLFRPVLFEFLPQCFNTNSTFLSFVPKYYNTLTNIPSALSTLALSQDTIHLLRKWIMKISKTLSMNKINNPIGKMTLSFSTTRYPFNFAMPSAFMHVLHAMHQINLQLIQHIQSICLTQKTSKVATPSMIFQHNCPCHVLDVPHGFMKTDGKEEG